MTWRLLLGVHFEIDSPIHTWSMTARGCRVDGCCECLSGKPNEKKRKTNRLLNFIIIIIEIPRCLFHVTEYSVEIHTCIWNVFWLTLHIQSNPAWCEVELVSSTVKVSIRFGYKPNNSGWEIFIFSVQCGAGKGYLKSTLAHCEVHRKHSVVIFVSKLCWMSKFRAVLLTWWMVSEQKVEKHQLEWVFVWFFTLK